MPRNKSTHCRYCSKVFEPGDSLYHGAHRACHNTRAKLAKNDEQTRAKKAKDNRRRVIAARAKRLGVTRKEAEDSYNQRDSLKCACGADKTRLALRCPSCARKVINDRARMAEATKRASRPQRVKVPKAAKPAPAPASKLPKTWNEKPAKQVDKQTTIIIPPGVVVKRYDAFRREIPVGSQADGLRDLFNGRDATYERSI